MKSKLERAAPSDGGAKPHRCVDRLDRADAFVERVDRLVDHRQQNAVDDESRKSSDTDILPSLSTNAFVVECCVPGVVIPRINSMSSITGTGFMK